MKPVHRRVHATLVGLSCLALGVGLVAVPVPSASAAPERIEPRTIVSGDQDFAMAFDGTSQYGTAGTEVIPTSGPFTVSAWVFDDIVDDASRREILSQGNGGTAFYLGTVANSQEIRAGDTWLATGVDLPSGQWAHVALVADGSGGAVLYLNGQAAATKGSGFSAPSGIGAPFQIGQQFNSGEYWNGRVDQVKIYNVALDSTAIASDMQTYGMYASGSVTSSNHKAFYDFNEGPAGTTGTGTVYNRADGATSATNLRTVDGPTYADVKQTSSNGSNTVVTFPRSYLTAAGGWRMPEGVSGVNYLVVAGGGGGGGEGGRGNWKGGGGAGGQVDSGSLSYSSIPLEVSVGVGGIGGPADTYGNAGSGGSTTFGTATVVGGGRGGSATSVSTQSGGIYTQTTYNPNGDLLGGGGGAQIYRQLGKTGSVYSGGSGGSHPTDGTLQAGGGGAGAGGNGTAGASGTGGSGGNGFTSSITGTATTYGGGGGGGGGTTAGTGGTGGGGSGGLNSGGADGSANSGGGGGGTGDAASPTGTGGNGGSGVVIVSYTTSSAACTPETTQYGPYTYVAFKDDSTTCTWTVPSGVSKVDYLVVAGGGGGGSRAGGGGGAGGMLDDSASVTAGLGMTVTVGAGGAGGTGATQTVGAQGGGSSISGGGLSSPVSAVGGGAGGAGATNGGLGGSGGGSLAGTAGAATAGQGNAGGAGAGISSCTGDSDGYCAGGGGGAGGVGETADSGSAVDRAGNGGAGATVTWLDDTVASRFRIGDDTAGNAYFAGGGGGGVDQGGTAGLGGAGGGGDGSAGVALGQDASPNTGGGGGGSGYETTAGQERGGYGGSGVVVLRYVTPSSSTCTSPTYAAEDTYIYVAFKTTETCSWTVPAGVTSVDYLVVAGGGGGGTRNAGGGGAGGLLKDDTDITPGQALTVTVGAGGAGGLGGTSSPYPPGDPGGDSQLSGGGLSSPITASGGGGGAWQTPGDGGSGGGGGLTGGSGEVGQGNNGGLGALTSTCNAAVGSYCGGGGGGAGGAGENSDDTGISEGRGGNGGVGLTVPWIDATVATDLGIGDDSLGSIYFAGGGGGGVTADAVAGVGGAGGGGSGSVGAVVGGSGLANTGGGGGGSGVSGAGNLSGGVGGSGVVVLRYAAPATFACTPLTYTSGAYTIQEFRTVGECFWTVPSAVSSVDVLAVGGGGGGGAWVGGGGGGGGVTEDTGVSVTGDDTIDITVGAGGSGAGFVGPFVDGSNGESSTFDDNGSTITALGGGVGASWNQQAAGTGASVATGGGGSQTSGTFIAGNGATSAGGAAGSDSPPHPVGGGGGAGGNGNAGSGSVSGSGGIGAESSITGAVVPYGGGGGGGAHGTWTSGGAAISQVSTPGSGGSGGGGTGSGATAVGQTVLGRNGTDGLGGGGGGAGNYGYSRGGDGGSGVVVVRYFTRTMAVTSGDNQQAAKGATIPNAISVTITNADGSAAASVPVTFAVATGGGSITSASQTTNGSGLATLPANAWTLGNTAGAQTLSVTAADTGLSPVTVTATSLASSCDIGFSELIFDYANAVNQVGNGKNQGDKVLFPDVSSRCGGIDALVTTSTLSNSTITNYEAGARAGGENSFFQVDTNVTASNGYAEFTFDFYETGTYGTTNVPVTLLNVHVTGIDIDANQFNYFTGLDAYTLASNTRLTTSPSSVSSFPADVTFQGPSGSANNDPRDQVVATYGEIDQFKIRFGNKNRYSPNYFGVAFKELGWSPTTPQSFGPTYTLTYDGNGNTGGTAPASQSGVLGASVNVRANTGTLVRTGYTFQGWSLDDSTGSGTIYQPGDGIFIPQDGGTMYAIWAANPLTLTYNGNGNTGGTVPSSATLYQDDTRIVAAGTVTRTGYTFSGWNTAANGSGTPYAAASTFTMSTADVTLYAQWTPTTYVLTYDDSAGTGGPVTANVQSGSTITLNDGSSFSRTGYWLNGWIDGSGNQYPVSSSFVMPPNDDTLYANWVSSLYNLSYAANGGTGSFDDSYGTGSTVTVRSSTGFTRAGYTFAAWNSTASGSGTEYAPSDTFTMPASNTVIYAQWTPIAYAVTYNANGGTGAPAAQRFDTDDTATLRSGVPTRTGYAFAGWNTTSDGSGTGFGPSGAFRMPPNDVALYAQWVAQPQTVRYLANAGGAPVTNLPSDDTALSGANFTVDDSLPVRAGYAFTGWDTATDGSGSSYSPGTVRVMPGGGLTLYAQWSATVYTVTYNLGGGTGTTPADDTALYEDLVTLPASTGFSRSGYTFTGWLTNPGAGAGQAAGETFTMPAANIIMYAQWQADPHTLYYDANGGTGAPADDTALTDDTLAISVTQPTRTGYWFNGWSTTDDSTGTLYPSGSTYTMGTADDTLYALWVSNLYNLTYNANGGTGSQDDTHGTGSPVTVDDSTGFARTGYTFVTWNTAANGSGDDSAPGSTFTMPPSNLALYAQWAPASQDLIYDDNGGSGGPADDTALTGDPISVSFTQPTRTGYLFTGWNTISGGTGAWVPAGTTFPMPATGRTLYAQWTPRTYVLIYEPNGGVNAPAPQGEAFNSTVTVGGAGSMTRAGYTFDTWNTAGDGSGTTRAPSSTFTMPADDTRLYALWTPASQPLVYEPNAGSDSVGNMPTDDTALTDDTLTISNLVPTRTNYVFVGWSTSASGAGTSIATQSVVTMVPGGITLYARWAGVEYSLTYNANGGTGEPSPEQHLAGQTVTVSGTSPSRTGFTFNSWNTESDGTGTTYVSGDTFAMPGAATILYAMWDALPPPPPPPPAPVSITTVSIPGGSTDDTYSKQIEATGGTGPYTWQATGLPPGLSIDPKTGVISGTPGAPGTYTVTVTVKDSTGEEASKEYPLTITGFGITTPSLPKGTVDELYSKQVETSGGTGPFSWTATGLPPGLTIDPDTGVIAGIPTKPGNYKVRVRVVDATGKVRTRDYVLVIEGGLPIITTTSLPPGETDEPYSEPVEVSGGYGPFTWTATGLPPGLTIDPDTGVISGTPTEPGTYTVTVTVTDSEGESDTKELDIVIGDGTKLPQVITFIPIPDQILGVAPFPADATTDAVGLVPTVTSRASSVCSISGVRVTVLAVGTCTLRATQAGDDTYLPAAPVSVSFAITQGGLPPYDGTVPTISGQEVPLPMPDLPEDSTVKVRKISKGYSDYRVVGNQIYVTPKKSFTGNIVVRVKITVGGKSTTDTITVVVSPLPPSNPATYTLASRIKGATVTPRTFITWRASPTKSVTHYTVYVNGREVCDTERLACFAVGAYGPESTVTAIAHGRQRTRSTERDFVYVSRVPEAQKVVFFAKDSASLSPAAIKELKKVVRLVKKQGFTAAQVDGYAQCMASPQAAMLLSERRADAVAQWLAKRLPSLEISTKGYGDKRPVVPCGGKEDQGLNDRAVVRVE